MKLLDLPRDIILSALYFLHVRQFLALELTCSYLRDVVATRHLWLLELQRLVLIACIPPFPSHSHVDQLDYAEIRKLVVRALCQARIYTSLKQEGLNNSSARQTVIYLETPENAQRTQDVWKGLFYRLLPSSNYLLVASAHCLEIFNVKNGDCVWTYKPELRPHSAKFCGFAFDETSETSFNLFLLSYSPTPQVLLLLFLQFKESRDEERLYVQAIHTMNFSGVPTSFWPCSICLSGDFAAFGTQGLLGIWKWKKREAWLIDHDLGTLIRSLQIVQGYLSYLCVTLRGRFELKVARLDQFTSPGGRMPIEDVQSGYFEPFITGGTWFALPKVLLYDLRRFGFQDQIICYFVTEAATRNDRHAYMCFATRLSFDRGWIDIDLEKSLPILPSHGGSRARFESSAPNGSLIPTSEGCVVRDWDDTETPDNWTFRLKPNGQAHAWGFNENGMIYPVEIPANTEAFDLVLQFDSGCLQAFTNEESGPKRVVIHHLV